MSEIESKVRNVIGRALYLGQGESKPTVDDVMRWFEFEGVGFRGITWSAEPPDDLADITFTQTPRESRTIVGHGQRPAE